MKTQNKIKTQKAKKTALTNLTVNQLNEAKMKQVFGGHNVVWAI